MSSRIELESHTLASGADLIDTLSNSDCLTVRALALVDDDRLLFLESASILKYAWGAQPA